MLRVVAVVVALGITGCSLMRPGPEPPPIIGGTQVGIASWYGPGFQGKPTASGEAFDQWGFTAAHRTLPMDSVVRVTSLSNGKTVRVRVNDRGPFVRGRIIDLSRAAAGRLQMIGPGLMRVRVEVLDVPAAADTTRFARSQGARATTTRP